MRRALRALAIAAACVQAITDNNDAPPARRGPLAVLRRGASRLNLRRPQAVAPRAAARRVAPRAAAAPPRNGVAPRAAARRAPPAPRAAAPPPRNASCAAPAFLRFSHIAKNAGTTIEDVARAAGACLGRFAGHHDAAASCPTWHVPPRRAAHHYCGKVVFCVVREPVSRFLSAFRHNFHRLAKRRRDDAPCTRQHLESFVVRSLRRGDETAGFRAKNVSRGHPLGCHLLAQTAYLHGGLGGQGGACGCAHALRLPTLAADLRRLEGHFRVRLGDVAAERRNAKDGCGLTAADLSRASRRLVEEAYAEDAAIYARLAAATYDPARPFG